MGKKHINRIVALLLLSSLPLASEEFFSFIGINAGYQTMQTDAAYHTEDTTHTTVAMRIGTQTRKWRASIALENGNKYRAFDMNLDVIPFDTFFGTPKVRPYLGISGTILNYENESIPESDGFAFGGTVGFLLYAGDRVDIDVAYRYSTVNIDGVDSMQGVRLGIHYFY